MQREEETLRASASRCKVSLISGRARFVSDVLSHRWLPAWLGLLGMLLMVPAVWHGFLFDDYVVRAKLSDPTQLDERLFETGWAYPSSSNLTELLPNLWRVSGPGEDLKKLMEYGVFPWWTAQDLRVSFFQPLTNLTLWADYELWPNSPELMHVHSIVWFGAAIAAIAFLYRSLLSPPWIAGLAALLYTIDESFYIPVAWISCRNSLTALFFGVLAILCHHKWRDHGSRAAAFLSPVLLLCCVLSKEFGASIAAYYVAYACFFERGTLTKRACSLVPSLALLGLWKTLHSMFSYGISSAGYYTDPFLEPVRFAGELLDRAPVLLFSQWSLVAASLNGFLTTYWQGVLWWIAIFYLTVLFLTMLPLLWEDRVARFWGSGMIMCVAPAACTNFTEDRYLIFVSIGAMGLAAQFIGGVFQGASWLPKRRSMRIAVQSICFLLILTHLAGAGVGRVIRPYSLTAFQRYVSEPCLKVTTDPELNHQDLVIINAPNPVYFIYFPLIRSEHGESFPRSVRILSPAFGSIEVARTGEKELVLRSHAKSLLAVAEATELPPVNSIIRYLHDVYGYRKAIQIFRKGRCGMAPGDQATLSNLTIDVLKVAEDGCPSEASFVFSVPLEDSSLRWLQWDWRTMSYLPFTPPEVGNSVVVRGAY